MVFLVLASLIIYQRMSTIYFFKGLQLLSRNTTTLQQLFNNNNVCFFPSWLMFFTNVVLISFKHYLFITYITKHNITIWLLAYIVGEIKWVKKKVHERLWLYIYIYSLRISLLVNMNEFCIHKLLDSNEYNWHYMLLKSNWCIW